MAQRIHWTCGPALIVIAIAALTPLQVHSQGAGLGAAGELVDPDKLRVCADPSNMPFSDRSGEGFEDKLAAMVAAGTGRSSVAYTWFPSVMGFVRNTLNANLCDIIMGYAQGDELVQNTNPYYRSAYVLLYEKDGDLAGVETLADPRLADKRIGVVQGTPPSGNMAAANLMRKARIYPLVVDTRVAPSMAEVMIRDIASGTIDAAAVWGPMAGYYVLQSEVDLAVVPLTREVGGSRMTYRITMGVRPSDQEWKRTLNTFIRDHQADINELLLSYGVPLLNEQDEMITE